MNSLIKKCGTVKKYIIIVFLPMLSSCLPPQKEKILRFSDYGHFAIKQSYDVEYIANFCQINKDINFKIMLRRFGIPNKAYTYGRTSEKSVWQYNDIVEQTSLLIFFEYGIVDRIEKHNKILSNQELYRSVKIEEEWLD